MKIYNSLTNKIESFKSIKENEVSMYVCGPTVYNDPHIGNARPLVVFDMVYRIFSELGYKVNYVSNYTDIDDKIIDKAIENQVSATDIANKYIKVYEDLAKSLNVIPPKTIKVTDTMPEIIAYIQKLIDEEYAYAIDGDVYFRVSKVSDYGKLSNQNTDDLLVGARIEENDKKENPLDFTLWKQTERGEVFPSNFGAGRPGWHTECVVMIEKMFKQTIDIHGGGLDLKFPHHENELAQAIDHEHKLANYWMHNGLINIDNKKMSKSAGTMILAKDMVSDYGYELVRWLLLSTHYRAPLALSDDYISQAQIELERIQTALNQALVKLQLADFSMHEVYDQSIIDDYLNEFKDDFNTANAYKIIFDTLKLLNSSLRVASLDLDLIMTLTNTIYKMLSIIGIDLARKILTSEDLENMTLWNEAKANKDFELADKYRDILMERGLI
ncbi:MAG: cysteine--tRNA ligase [Erysipelothrix sp.]|nr:cysteine--tRNA ligase [Erysipelothrix sp.]